jgi:hypothetical protein
MRVIRKTRALVAAAIIVLGFAALTVASAVRISSSFRKAPRERILLQVMHSARPDRLLARAIFFRKGAASYREDLHAMAYAQPSPVADNAWNRWILERELLTLDASEAAPLLATIPVTPSGRILGLLEKELTEDRCEVLPTLARVHVARAETIYRNWVEGRMQRPDAAKYLSDHLACFTASVLVPPSRLLDATWEHLSEEQKQDLTSKDYWYPDFSKEVAADVIAWLSRSLDGGRVRMESVTGLLGAATAKAASWKTSRELFAKHGHTLESHSVFEFFEPIPDDRAVEMAASVFETLPETDGALPRALFHVVAHRDIVRAERLAASHLTSADDPLLNDLVVLLVRHGSSLGGKWIDRAFQGQRPRSELFSYISQYLEGSRATDLYREISGHDLMAVGKLWLLQSAIGGWSGETVRWPEFIKRFPWHPSTDDAYYRLAFGELALGKPREALDWIGRYQQSAHPDRDAEPFLFLTARRALAKDPTYAPVAWAFVTTPLAGALLGSQQDLLSYRTTVSALLKGQDHAVLVGCEETALRRIFTIADAAIQAHNLEERLELTRKSVSKQRIPLPLLFGWCTEPPAWTPIEPDWPASEDVLESRFADEPLGDVVRRVAEQLHAPASDVRSAQAIRDWTDWIAKEVDDPYASAAWHRLWAPITEAYPEAVDTSKKIPGSGSMPKEDDPE